MFPKKAQKFVYLLGFFTLFGCGLKGPLYQTPEQQDQLSTNQLQEKAELNVSNPLSTQLNRQSPGI